MGCAVVAGLATKIFGVLSGTTVQQETPHEKLSRISSYDALGSWALTPLGFAIRGPARTCRTRSRWVEKNAPLVRWQLEHKRGFRTRVSTGGLENVLARVSSAFEVRRGQLTNRDRLDLRLKLMELEMRNAANASHYAKVIREQLLANGGYGASRNLYDDQGPHPSLRPPLPVGRDKLRAEKRAEAAARALANPPEPDIPF